MSPLQRHVFVCVNEREAKSTRGCCHSKGGEAIRDELKKQLAANHLLGIVRANKAGCLDQCENGVAMVVYPEQVWYGAVTLQDVHEIVQKHIIKGEYVQRLMLEGQDHLVTLKGRALDIPGQGDA